MAYRKRSTDTPLPLPEGQFLVLPNQAMRYLPLSLWSIREMMKDGRLRTVRISDRLTAIPSDSIREFMAKGVD